MLKLKTIKHCSSSENQFDLNELAFEWEINQLGGKEYFILSDLIMAFNFYHIKNGLISIYGI
jgi:hypothetical protein